VIFFECFDIGGRIHPELNNCVEPSADKAESFDFFKSRAYILYKLGEYRPSIKCRGYRTLAAHAYLGNDALMYLDWKVHEGEHALLKYGRPRGDGMAFVARESEFHVDNEDSRKCCNTYVRYYYL
jgi:hypothetical protein